MDRNKISLLDRKRVVFLSIVIFFLFGLLISQYFRIQITEGPKWTKIANRQHFFTIKEPFQRGSFFSNTGIKNKHPDAPLRFVIDVQKFHLYIDPSSIPKDNKTAIANQLQRIMKLDADEQLPFRAQFNKKSRSRKLAMWLDSSTRDAIMEWWSPYAHEHSIPKNALFFVSDYQRSYPFGKLLGQVLHTIQNNKDEKTKQALPTGGLELSFNNYLKGKQGKRRLMRSPRNALETGEVILSPENGADVYLTINHCLQEIAEEEIEKGVKKANAKSGWAVMMNPFTGEILALAQYPFFYPPEYQHYFNNKELMEHTRVKAVSDNIEPGSVLKACTVTLALLANEELKKRGELPLFNPDEKTATSNAYFTGRSKPLNDTHHHDFLNMDMAVQKSSNIYMARLAEKMIARLGKEWYRNALQTVFGFGVKTGIELPAESSGVLPTPGKKHPNGTFEWSASTPYSLAIGYNIQTNSIQLLRAYAVFANGGYLVQPTLIRKITKTYNHGLSKILVDNTNDEKLAENKKLVLSPEIVERVIESMKYVTKQGGTAPRGNVWGYTEAGKTSTSKKLVNGLYSETAYSAKFIGFTPIKDAAFVIMIGLDEPEYGYAPGIGKKHHGGNCCAPVFREIATRSLSYMGITPDDPYGYPNTDPRHDKDKADWLPEIRKLQEMYETWNKGKHA